MVEPDVQPRSCRPGGAERHRAGDKIPNSDPRLPWGTGLVLPLASCVIGQIINLSLP